MKERGCDQLFAGLKSLDDDNKALVFERGDCDLKKFAQLREEAGLPLSSGELLYITLYLFRSMNLLHQVGIYLCDMKPANVLVVMDHISAEKYHPILTDLGGASDRTS